MGERFNRVGPTAAIPGFAFAEILAARTSDARPDSAAPAPAAAARDERPAPAERAHDSQSRDSAPLHDASEGSDLSDDSLPLPDTATGDTDAGDHDTGDTGSDNAAGDNGNDGNDGNQHADTESDAPDHSATGDDADGETGENPAETDTDSQPVVVGQQAAAVAATVTGTVLPGSGQQNGTGNSTGSNTTGATNTGAIDPAAAVASNTGAVNPAIAGSTATTDTGDAPGPVTTTGPGNSQGQTQADQTGGRHRPTLPGNASPVAQLATAQGGQAVAAAAQAGTLPKGNAATGQTSSGVDPAAAAAAAPGNTDGDAGQTGLPLLADGDGEDAARPGTPNNGPANRPGGGQATGASHPGQTSGTEGQTPGAHPAATTASQPQPSQTLAAIQAFADTPLTGSDGIRTAVDPLAPVSGTTNGPLTASTVSKAAAQAAANRSGAAHSPAAEQVAVRIQKAVAEGMDRIQIRLNPASLGRVNISMEMTHDGRVIAVVAVDNPETLEILKQDSQGLQRALQDAGLQADSDSLSFTMNDGDGNPADDGFSQAAGPDGQDAAPDSLDNITAGRMIAGRGLLDIHV